MASFLREDGYDSHKFEARIAKIWIKAESYCREVE